MTYTYYDLSVAIRDVRDGDARVIAQLALIHEMGERGDCTLAAEETLHQLVVAVWDMRERETAIRDALDSATADEGH
jgi:hypothetical protein